jgi:limonene-1,2-epoxide hydrolase
MADQGHQSMQAPTAAGSGAGPVSSPPPLTVVENLRDATNRHDIDGIVACFAAGYRNETPAHPGRSFVGRDQVRRNWVQILGAIPDVTTDILDSAADGDAVWSEWRHQGTRADGSRHLMAGVIVFRVAEGVIQSARFFLEPVEVDGEGIGDVVRRQVTPPVSA